MLIKLKLLFVLAFITVLASCSTAEEPISQQVEQIVMEKTGMKVYIPDHSSYTIGTAGIGFARESSSAGKGIREPNQIFVEYFMDTDERMEFTDEMIAEVEESNQIEYVINELYDASPLLTILIHKDGYGTVQGAEWVELDGIDVQYQFLERDPYDLILYVIPFEQFDYFILYSLTDGDLEEDAREFALSVIRELRE